MDEFGTTAKLSPNEGEPFDTFLDRCKSLSDKTRGSVQFTYDGAKYLWEFALDIEAKGTQKAQMIDEFILRRTKRYCRSNFDTMYKDAKPDQIAAAKEAVLSELVPNQDLTANYLKHVLHKNTSNEKEDQNTYQSHPNVTRPSYLTPVQWRDVINVQGYAQNGFSKDQTKAIEHCLDEMSTHIPEFRLLIQELNEPHLRFDEEGLPRPKLNILPSDMKTGDHYHSISNTIELNT